MDEFEFVHDDGDDDFIEDDHSRSGSSDSSSEVWRNRHRRQRSLSSSSFLSSTSKETTPDKDETLILTKNLLNGLDRLRQEERFCDITIKVNDVKIPAHKNILCAYSPYFNAMFAGYFKEKNDNTIEIENLDPEALKLIIDYLYTGKLNITKNNVQSVLDTAHFLQIDPAQEMCCEHIAKEVNNTNCVEFLTVAGKYGSESLMRTSIRKTVKNFFKLYGKDELLNIEFHGLKKLLSTKSIKYYPPSYLFNLIIRWVEKLPQERLIYLNELLCDFIDAGHITRDQVNSCRTLLEAASTSSKSSSPSSLVTECNQWLNDFENNQKSLEVYIFVCNRLSKFHTEIYDLKTGQSNTVEYGTKLNPGSSYLGHNNTIYVHGGWKSKGSYVDDAFCYNIFEGKWTKFIPMHIARAYHRTCALNGYLYIVGGGFTTKALECVETVDLTFGTSIVVNSLSNARSSMGISTYANSIYVVAGINAEENLVTVERFDPREGKWTVLPKRCYGYGVCSSAVIRDSMYCTMGPGKSMERYDFRMDEWTLIKTQRDRYPNELFSIGSNLHGIFYDNMAEYDVNKGVWNVYRAFDEYKSNYTTAITISIPEL